MMVRRVLVLAAVLCAAERGRSHESSSALQQEWFKSYSSHEPRHRHRRDAACGGAYNQDTEVKTVTSPGYPADYHNSADCYYTIEAPAGHYVEVTFEDFRIEIPRTSSSNCTYDGLTVRDGAPNGPPMGRYCGKVKPPNFRSRTNLVMLHFYSDESLGFRGFKMHYSVRCGATFFSEHGTLHFNENEAHIPASGACDYELVTTPDKYLDLNFTINGLTVTHAQVFDHETVVRTLKKAYDYSDMDVRVVSVGNIVRVRFMFEGLGEGSVVIAYQAHSRTIVSGSPVLLVHLQSCKGLAEDTSSPGNQLVRASNTTKDAVVHRIERVGGHQNDTIAPGDAIYLRTMIGGNRPFSLSASRDGDAGYDDTARDNSTWKLHGHLVHGGRVWIENKQASSHFLGMYGTANQLEVSPFVEMKVGLCSAPTDWIIYKIPLDFGWDKYAARGAYQARWVDGLSVAAYKGCLPHPLLFPYCAGSPRPQCPGT